MKNRLLIVTDAEPFRLPSKAIESIIAKWKHCYHVIKVLPSIKVLIEDDKNEVVVLGLNVDLRKILQREKIGYKNKDDYLDEATYRAVYDDVMSFVKKLPDLKGNEWFKEITTYEGISLWDLEELEIYEYLVWILENIVVVKRAIENESPSKIVVIDSKDPAGKAAVVFGAKYKIPTYTQDGLIENMKHQIMKSLSSYATKFMMPSAVKQLRKCRRKRLKTDGFPHKLNKVLILVDNPRFTTLTIPIIKELLKNHRSEVLVVGLDESAREKYEPENISYKTFKDYVDIDINRLVNKLEESHARNWHDLKNNKIFKHLLTYQEVPLWDLVENLLLFVFRTRFVEFTEYLEILKNVINIERPDAIVVWDDRSRFGKTVVATAHLKKIPSIIVQHGVMSGLLFDTAPTLADKVAVFGQYRKECLIKVGEKPEKIVVTGSPIFDRTMKIQADKEKICSELGIDVNKKIIVFTTQPLGQEMILRNILNALKHLPEFQLIIKLHPTENGKMHMRVVKEMNANAIITKDVDLYGLLSISDVMLSESSTTALEAMILGKTVIIINFDNKPELVPYVKRGAAIGVYKPENIISAVKDALYNEEIRRKLEENRKRFVYEKVYNVDGKAAERIASLIEEMINERKAS